MWTFLLIWLTLNLIMLWYWTWCDYYRKFISKEEEDFSDLHVSKETVGCLSMILPLLPMWDILIDAIKNRK